jgi:acetyl esterase/lipase
MTGLLALDWLHERVAPARIGVASYSAGGGLAAELAVVARDWVRPPSRFRSCYIRCSTIAPLSKPRSIPLRAPVCGRARAIALAAPARREDLSRVPAALVLVAFDLYLDEEIRYAERLNRAGVPTELRVYEGTPHNVLAGVGSRIAQAAEREIVEHLVRNHG